jgi:hypothetical protein
MSSFCVLCPMLVVFLDFLRLTLLKFTGKLHHIMLYRVHLAMNSFNGNYNAHSFLCSALWIIVHRFSFLWLLYCLSFASFFLFMAIILSVLRLVFPFYGHHIVCPSPRFSFLWPLYCLSFASFFLFMAIILSVRLTASYYPFGIFNFPQISYNLFK